MISSASIFASMIFIPILLNEEMGASKLVIGSVVSAYFIAFFISSVFLGRFADVKGRRNILKAGFVLAAVATFLQAVAMDVFQLIIIRIMLGLAAGLVPSVLVGYFLYETKGKIGIFASFGSLGWALGSIAAGVLGDPRMIFIFAGGLMVMSAIAVWRLPKTPEITHRVPLFPKDIFKENAAVYLSVCIRHTGAHIVWVTYPLFLMETLGADKFWVGVIYATNAFTQFLIMRKLDRINPIILVTIGLGLSSLTFVLFAMVISFEQIIPLQAVLALSWSSLYVGSLKYVTERSSEKATSAGWLAGMIGVASIIGPFFGGLLNDLIDYRLTMLVASILCLISLGVFSFHRRLERRARAS